ncbi:hypothetical protein, partial [Sinomonas atrocyanea]|uniref:hypothetical protein n=1 Tax=Sinomonas atrocyanea TaxID=37927 RepID=UPI0027D9047A
RIKLSVKEHANQEPQENEAPRPAENDPASNTRHHARGCTATGNFDNQKNGINKLGTLLSSQTTRRTR